MALFGKREKAYEVWGDKPRWKEARQRLKDAGIKVMETGKPEDVERAKELLADLVKPEHVAPQ